MTQLVYVVAASHSGSTLLSMLLNTHEEIATAGELKAVNLGDPSLYRCSCHAFIQECSFWADVNASMRRCGHEFEIWDPKTDFNTVDSAYAKKLLGGLVRPAPLESVRQFALSLSPSWRRAQREALRRSVDLVHSVAEVAGVDVVVESSKVGQRLLQLDKAPDLDIHVVRMIRDGRAVALTYMRPNEFADAKDEKLRGGGRGGYRDNHLSMTEAAHEWRRSNEEAEALLPQLSVSSMTTVKYEDLCEDPSGVLSQIYTNIGLKPSSDIGQFKDAVHHVIGNGMRLDRESHVTLDDSWKRELTESDLRAFDQEAGELNRRYGYQ